MNVSRYCRSRFICTPRVGRIYANSLPLSIVWEMMYTCVSASCRVRCRRSHLRRVGRPALCAGGATALQARALKHRSLCVMQRLQKKNRQLPTLPHGHPCSTIGGAGLNCSVRNGKRCITRPIATVNFYDSVDLCQKREEQSRGG